MPSLGVSEENYSVLIQKYTILKKGKNTGLLLQKTQIDSKHQHGGSQASVGTRFPLLTSEGTRHQVVYIHAGWQNVHT